MSLERPAISSSSCTEIDEIILPEEVWIMIWSNLDFKTVQKTRTRVSKFWLKMIRSSKLSWEMKLRRTSYYEDKLEVKDFNAILSHWNDLRVIQLSSEPDFDKFHLSLNSHESLEKIVIPSTFQLYFDHTFWGISTKYYIDPSHLLTPADIVRNVIEITSSTLESFAEEFALRKNDWDLTNLESLQICVFSIFIPKTEFVLRFKNLKNLEIFYDEMDINYLLDILHFLGNTKTVHFC